MRTREAVIAHYSTVLKGMIADAAVVRRTGGELSMALEVAFSKAEIVIGQCYDELTKSASPPAQPKGGKP